MSNDETENEVVIEDSTTADNLKAWKELLSSTEAKEFTDSFLAKLTILFGQTSSTKIINITGNILLMLTAFICVGALAFYKLVPDGTTGVLSGIIIGYFFKRED